MFVDARLDRRLPSELIPDAWFERGSSGAAARTVPGGDRQGGFRSGGAGKQRRVSESRKNVPEETSAGER